MTKHTVTEAEMSSLGAEWFDPLETGVRQQIRKVPMRPGAREALGTVLEATLPPDKTWMRCASLFRSGQ